MQFRFNQSVSQDEILTLTSQESQILLERGNWPTGKFSHFVSFYSTKTYQGNLGMTPIGPELNLCPSSRPG